MRTNVKIKNTLRTHEGAHAVALTPTQQLERSVMACLLFESEFYEDGQEIAERICALVKQVPAFEVARIAIEAKQEMRLRHVPLLLARELLRTKEGRKEFGMVAERVFTRADDIPEFLAIYWRNKPDEPLAKQAKKHVGNAFRRFDEYQLGKYNGGSKAFKLRDALRILRPKPANAEEAELWRKVVKDELATPDTWEVAISAAGMGLKDEEKKVAKGLEWVRLIKEGKLGGLAMLRNIRNMREAGVKDEYIREGIAGVQAGKLLPINFIASARHNPQFEPELEKKFLECFAGKEKLPGKTILLVDVSSSMSWGLSGRSEMNRMDVACSLAMIGREMFEDLQVFSFSDKLVEVPARHGFALRDAIVNSQIHNGTDLGNALRKLPKCDRLIVITDEQSSTEVPQMKGYMINVASAKNGVGYHQWVHFDGWSDKVLDYIVKYEGNAS